ncbi:MAG: hypothetical protein JW726_06445, partial [Anaerolineales bacterium]|nr:hypothetical protein [Anaerolineales bacterium]
MDSLAGDLWQHTSEALSNVEQAYWSHIETISSLHRDELQWLADQYNQASSRDQQKMDFAHQWLEMVNRMFASITSIYDHQRYLPGAMKKIQARIAQADLTYQQSIPETTLALTQAIFLDLSEIRVTLEKRQLQFHTLLQAASQYASRLEKKAHKYTQISAMDLQGHPLPLLLDVNYWVKGAFHDLTRRIETLRAELSENPQHFSIAELQDILE